MSPPFLGYLIHSMLPFYALFILFLLLHLEHLLGLRTLNPVATNGVALGEAQLIFESPLTCI